MSDTKQTLATSCFERLTGDILSGKILPGEKLLSEVLKERYQVGMSPIREALSRLATSGLVTFEEHKGYSVTKLTKALLEDDIGTFSEVECLCLQKAMNNGDDAWEGEIIAALHCLKKVELGSSVHFSTWAPQNIRFHNALVAACPLRTLLEIRKQLYMRHQWYIMLSFHFANESILKANHEEHKQIADAVLARESTFALKLLKEHITLGIPDLIQNLHKQGVLNG